MLFKFLIFIVFIAELIITYEIIINLVKFDKIINSTNEFLNTKKSDITDIAQLCNKLSEQILELSSDWVENLKKSRDKIILNQVKSLITGILFWSINIKVIKQLRKSKFLKAIGKGLTLVRNMI